MRRALSLLFIACLGFAALGGTCGSGVNVSITATHVTLENPHVRRTWTRANFGTTELQDLRSGLTVGAGPDFLFEIFEGTTLSSLDTTVSEVIATSVADGGISVTFTLTPLAAGLPAGTIERTYTMWPDVAGYQVDTVLALPGSYTGYTLDMVALSGATAEAHHFNGGYDWRGSDEVFDWSPTASPFAGSHSGQDHRHTNSGVPLDVTAQWLSLDSDGNLATTDDPRVFQVLHRMNYDSSHAAYDGATGRIHIDLADDLVYLGPFEGEIHLDNPAPSNVRTRFVEPLERLPLERVFTGVGIDADDEVWQHYAYLRRHAWSDWAVGDVVYNSNGVDSNRISTGAKDDMDLAETVRQAEIAAQIGIETFILDDGWQAASGDWCPDSPDCPEPRKAVTGWPDRFPDDEFIAVRDVLAQYGGMRLGLWFTPMQFNPAAEAYQENPTWACSVLGDALVLYNTVEPDSSSNEAGLGTWNPRGVALDGILIDHIESRIRRAIDVYGARYFKFDFLAWIDCAGADGVDAYEYRESFVAMLDRLIAAYPAVTFQIDETNDYRLFPFESATRGPSWYANGGPRPNEALHNLWVLAPYVPGATIGQGAMARPGQEGWSSDYVASTMLGSHVTFFRNLVSYSEEQIDASARWVALYKAHRDRFTQLTYPLLEDPLPRETWTALQWWDLDAQRGAVAVYRQEASDTLRPVPLRGIRGEGSYRLTDAVSETVFGTFTAAQLRAGFDVTLPDMNSSIVLLIDPI